jgi:hypothetical protein
VKEIIQRRWWERIKRAEMSSGLTDIGKHIGVKSLKTY